MDNPFSTRNVMALKTADVSHSAGSGDVQEINLLTYGIISAVEPFTPFPSVYICGCCCAWNLMGAHGAAVPAERERGARLR